MKLTWYKVDDGIKDPQSYILAGCYHFRTTKENILQISCYIPET